MVSESTPLPTVSPPVWMLLAVRVSVPVPALVSPAAPLSTEPIVAFWLAVIEPLRLSVPPVRV